MDVLGDDGWWYMILEIQRVEFLEVRGCVGGSCVMDRHVLVHRPRQKLCEALRLMLVCSFFVAAVVFCGWYCCSCQQSMYVEGFVFFLVALRNVYLVGGLDPDCEKSTFVLESLGDLANTMSYFCPHRQHSLKYKTNTSSRR